MAARKADDHGWRPRALPSGNTARLSCVVSFTRGERGPVAEQSVPSGALTPVRVRARLARLTAQRQQADPALEPLFRIIRANHPKADLELIERAYRSAARAHS